MANGPPTASGNGSSVFTLHVLNLPSELEQDGVLSMFTEYGQVIGFKVLKSKNDTNQAFVSYSKYDEAENAVIELHEKLPLMLSIQFKDKNLRKTHSEVVVDLSRPIQDYRYKDSFLDTSHGLKKVIDVGKANCSPTFQSNTYTPSDDLLYPVPTDPSIYNPYESTEPYRDTNLMYTRGVAHVSEDGKRHISYGRGYTYYNLPEPHYNIAKYLQSVCEKRENGAYEYAIDVEDEMGVCKICSSPTAFKCQKCLTTFYCSKSCQVVDWPQHKLDCQQIPPLVKKLKLPVQNGQKKDTLSTEPDDCAPLRRPHTFSKQNTQHQATVQNLTENLSDKETVEPKGLMNTECSPKNNFKATTSSFPKSITQQKLLQKNVNDNTVSSNDSRLKSQHIQQKNSDDNITFEMNKTFIPKDKFIKVMITSAINDKEFWVQKVEDSQAISNLFELLEEFASKRKLVAPEENVKCIIKQESLWFRATIVSLGVKESKVFSHDFGTIENMVVKEVCPIDDFEDLPPYCRRIRLAQNIFQSKDNAFEHLMVKALNVEGDGTIIVQAKVCEESTDNTLTEKMAKCTTNDTTLLAKPDRKAECEIALSKLANLPSVFESLTIGDTGMIVVLGELSKGEFSSSIVPGSKVQDFSLLLEELKTDCESQLKKNPNFSPNVGDFICGRNESDEWFRGIVLTKVPVIKLAIVDESRVIVPTACTPLLDKYSTILGMGMTCKFSSKIKLPDPMFYSGKFTVDEIKSQDSLVVTVINEEDTSFVTKALLKKWIPKPEQKGIQYAKLTSGQQVIVTHFSSQNLIYVQHTEKAEKERLHRLEQETAECALNKQPLTESPVIGEMVLAYYPLDQNYYRGIVTKIEGQKVMIKYIDYGNEEPSEINKLYKLSERLKEQPSCAVKIKLKDVRQDVPLTVEATDYIQDLIINSVPLICTFSGDPFETGVVLKTPKNHNVNNDLQNLLTPTWDKLDMNKITDKKVFQLSDLPPLKLGDVGDELEAIMLFYYPENGSFIVGPNDMVVIQAIHEEMTMRIEEYVKKTTSHYIPRDNELCIAKYQNIFYRGLCLDSSATPTESRIFFIDFGNTECVKHTDIRLFTEDFANFGGLATLCSISPMVPADKFTDQVSERISQLAPINDLITIKIISIDDDFSPNIDVPAIRIMLSNEGLI